MPGANDRLNLAWIGVGRRAHQMLGDLRSAPSVPGEARVVAVADVYLEKCKLYIDAYRETVLRGEDASIDVYQDYRKILDRDDIDAVMVPTPEHWRAAALHPRVPGRQGRVCRKALEPDHPRRPGHGASRAEI